ncbi:MAG: hypothetical protein ABMA64_26360 [Myxococcota bacterium]
MWVWLWGACAGETPVTGPRTWDGEFLIDSILIECDTLGWRYDVRTLGWGEAITLDFVGREFGTIAIREHHELPEVEFGEDWARFALELDQAGYGDPYEPEASTGLACEAKTFVTYGFGAWRYDGELEECAAWGLDPVGEFPQCVNWGENGHGAISR